MKIQVDSVVRMHKGDDGLFPTFRVKGSVDGQAFTRDVSLELDGREADEKHVDGVDLDKLYGFEIDNGDLYDLVYESQAFKDAKAAEGFT